MSHEPQRIVVLGASNVTLGMAPLVETLRARWPTRLRILAAHGHGRSYGGFSRVCGRTLPGITRCGLWAHLLRGDVMPTHAIVTDIGNDLMYGRSVDTVARWVERCLMRLTAHGARIVVTGLPVENLPDMSRARFLLCRSLFVPSCRASQAELSRDALQLHERVALLCETYGARFVPPNAAWYGWDPIHVRSARRLSAWQAMVGETQSRTPRPSSIARDVFDSLYYATRAPHQRWLFGARRRCVQPCARWNDGTTLSFF